MATRFPTMTFTSGDPVERRRSADEPGRDPTGAPRRHGQRGRRARAAARCAGAISRKAFSLDWPGFVEAGSLVVSDRVDLQLDVLARPA
jgi:hypothetical protein